jgi:hypothetical protein
MDKPAEVSPGRTLRTKTAHGRAPVHAARRCTHLEKTWGGTLISSLRAAGTGIAFPLFRQLPPKIFETLLTCEEIAMTQNDPLPQSPVESSTPIPHTDKLMLYLFVGLFILFSGLLVGDFLVGMFR